MRLALIGPAANDAAALPSVLEGLLKVHHVDRAVYLDLDSAVDDVVTSWAQKLVGEDASDQALWARATANCISAPPAKIRDYLARESEREQLRRFESLREVNSRSVEILGGRLLIMVRDRKLLSEEDLIPANYLAMGVSDGPILKQVGSRWFIAPGPLGGASGVVILDELPGGELQYTLLDNQLDELQKCRLSIPDGARVSVS